MTWEDVYFSRDVSPDNLIKALAHVFDVEESTIVIEYGWDWHDGLNDERIQLLCRLDIVKGDFLIRMEIALWRSELVPQDSERYHIIGRLCDLLNNSALVTGDARSPYIWTLIQGERCYQYVALDGDKLDSEDEEIELVDYLYQFNQRLPDLEIELGNLITRKEFDLKDWNHDVFMSILSNNPKTDLLSALNNARSGAKRLGREDVIDEAIDWLKRCL